MDSDPVRLATHVASYIIINGTSRPLNWGVYGHLTDIACTEPYPCNSYGMDFATVREQFILLRQFSAPKIMHACLENYTKDPPNKKFPRRARPVVAKNL